MGFAIIISEKGGAERREVFDRDEIHVGRVQGNDLMLPKGNVSKKHARLAFREGRFIVADLKSTNGTYVNGRKIAAATIVREGDKIYVGDFVLRFEPTPGTVLAAESTAGAPGPREATVSELGMPPSSQNGDASAMVQAPVPQDRGSMPPKGATLSPPVPRPPVPIPIPRPGSGGAVEGRGPAGTQMMPIQQPPPQSSYPDVSATSAPGVSPAVAPSASSMPSAVATPLPSTPSAASSAAPSSPAPALGEASRADHPVSRASREPSHTAHRLALATLVDRIGEMLDLASLDSGSSVEDSLIHRVERAVREQVVALREEGDIPGGVDTEALSRDAQRELLSLGPLGPLIDDDDVSEIQVLRYDDIRVLRGRQMIPIEPPFTSEESLRRAVARLCLQHAAQPLLPNETLVERRIPRVGKLVAVLSPVSIHGPVLILRKRRRVDVSLEDLVRNGTISRSMASILGLAHSAKANVLVVGAPGTVASSVLSALASLGASDERIVAVQDPEEPPVSVANATLLQLESSGQPGGLVLRMASQLPSDRLVIGQLSGHVAHAALTAVSEGARGVLAAVRAPTIRHALGRLVPEVCAAQPGLDLAVAREWIASSFDIVLEVARMRDGRHRAIRLAEIMGTEGSSFALRDIVTFSVDRASTSGAVEGSFRTLGVVPRFVEDLQSRGVPVDYGVFERA
ncbi:MAG: ATPase, T2SS/T4P/T4SS family [Polyangiaceae bacterium]